MDRCKVCHQPIYPYGVTYTGPSCVYGGNHPTQVIFPDGSVDELTVAIKELTRVLSQRLPQTVSQEDTARTLRPQPTPINQREDRT